MGANNPAKAAIEKGIQRIGNGEADKHAADAVSSLLGLESAVARRQGLELAGAIQARHQRFQESYRPTASRNVPTGLLDVTGLGIVALGQLNDLQVTGDSVYLPIEVLES